ncbi:MAG: aspartate aminotransferase family protein [Candidatus Bathyarchaeia archaeon]
MELESLRGPRIVSGPPGPRSRELMELKERYIARGCYVNLPIFIKGGRGALVEDVDGNIYIDFGSGIGVMSVGHASPEVVGAIEEQAKAFSHACFHITPYEGYVRVAERLIQATPGSFPKKAMLLNSGAEAIENSIKIALYHSKRPALLAFENAFHGRTYLAAMLSSKVKPNKLGFGFAFDNIERFPYAYCYRCAFGQTYPDCGLRCLGYIEDSFASRRAPEEIAALIAEPIQGEGGVIVPPDEFIRGLRRLCDRYGILFIADEIQTGLGRTGRMFACEHCGVEPDMITVAKSLAGGLPLAAVVGKRDVMDAPPVGGLGSTFGGNPVACAAALKALDAIQKLLPNSKRIGELMLKRGRELEEEFEIVGEARGRGAMLGIELVKDRRSKEPAREEARRAIEECCKRGLIILKAGIHDNVIRLLPPLAITEDLLERGFSILEEVLKGIKRP